jgi:hypothetical protein
MRTSNIAVCSMQYAACSMQYAVCSMQYAVCSIVIYDTVRQRHASSVRPVITYDNTKARLATRQRRVTVKESDI